MYLSSRQGKALLVALALASLPLSLASRASAAVFPSFSITPTSILEGNTSTLNLHLSLFADGSAFSPQFTGGFVTLSSGLGPSTTFSIGAGGTTRDFSATFNYPIAGAFTPSFSGFANYVQTVASQIPIFFSCGSIFHPSTCFGGFQTVFNQVSSGNSFSGFANLDVNAPPPAIAATPLPAALPLFGTALGFMSLMGWWRKRRSEAVA